MSILSLTARGGAEVTVPRHVQRLGGQADRFAAEFADFEGTVDQVAGLARFGLAPLFAVSEFEVREDGRLERQAARARVTAENLGVCFWARRHYVHPVAHASQEGFVGDF